MLSVSVGSLVTLTVFELVFAFVVLFLAAVVRGVIGFGLPLLATPFLILVLSPKTVIPAFIISLLATNFQILVHDGVPWEFLRDEWALIVTTVVGTVAGVIALSVSTPELIFLVVSVYVFVYLLLQRYEEATYEYANRRGAGTVVGLVSGVLGGLVSLQGVVLITYLHAKRLEKTAFVTAAAAMLFLGVAMRVPPMTTTGLLGVEEAVIGVGFLVPAVTGTYLGARTRPYVPRRAFELVVKALLALIAVKLALDGLGVELSFA